MKLKTIYVCTVHIPFVSGGAEIHAGGLVRELKKRGFEVELFSLPFKWFPKDQLIRDCIAWRLINLQESWYGKVDLVIPLKFPAYLIRHPVKVTWLLHQHREAYEFYDTPFTSFEKTPQHNNIRKKIFEMDRIGLGESIKIFTNSGRVSERLKFFNNLDSVPLYHPPKLIGKYRCAKSENYILSVGRLEANKRVDLAIKSIAYVKSDLKLIIAGEGPQLDTLKALVEKLKIEDRVIFKGFVSDEELIELYSKALAVIYPPKDEDFGYVTLEAFHSEKPIITAIDSGGVLEFVMDNENGFVVKPEPEQIAIKIDILANNRDLAERFGKSGKESIIHINWDKVIESLTEF